MADSLVLTGVKNVKKHTGSEMLLTRPKRGGDTHSLKQWWKPGSVSTCYVGCTVFDVTTAAGTVKLALDSNVSTNVRIDHDGAFNFTFFKSNEVRRAALFTESYELIEHYVFPAISGGKVMTVTPPGAADRPSITPPDTSITSVVVSGDDTANDGDDKVYNVAVTGDATPYTYTWTASGGSITDGQGSDSITVNWDTVGGGSVSCVVGSDNANFDGNTADDTLSVTVS